MATRHTTTSKKCNFSSIEHQPKAKPSSMDPTVMKSNTISTNSTTTTTKPHSSPPDAIFVPPSSTIHNISTHFAKLYANHKIHASLKGSSGLEHAITSFQEKGCKDSSALDASCLALTKSNSQHGRNGVSDLGKQSSCTRTKLKEKEKKSHLVVDVEKAVAMQKFNEVKRLSVPKKGEKEKNEFHDGKNVKKASALMSKSQGSHELKQFNAMIEMKRPSISLPLNGGGRRKSFDCSQTELADFFSCTGVKVVAVDMPPFMQIHAVDFARKTYDSLEKFTSKTLAFNLKKEFDGVYGPAWHCIVGTSFGSFVTHSVGGFMYFSMDHKLYILMFKTTVQRAD